MNPDVPPQRALSETEETPMKGMKRKSGVLGPRERRVNRCHGAGSAALGIATRGRRGLLLTGMALLAGCDGLASEVGVGFSEGALEGLLRAGRLPSPRTVPEGFVPHHVLEGVEPWQVTAPRMGLHWVNPAGAEFNGGPFTVSLLPGSWDGRFIFAEPMVSPGLPEGESGRDPGRPRGEAQRAGALRVYRDTGADEVRIALLNPLHR